ncbi:MAG: hypothetical protein WBC40_10410 [Halobacteriota archaeon]
MVKTIAIRKSGIQGLFTGAMAKVLDFLLTFEGFDYSKEEIARNILR